MIPGLLFHPNAQVLEVKRIEKILRRAEAEKLRLEELDARRRAMRKRQDRARLISDKKLEILQQKLVAGTVADTLAREFDAMGLTQQYVEIQDTAAIKIRDTQEEVKKTYTRIHQERKEARLKATKSRSRREPIKRAKADLAQTQRRRQKLRNMAKHRDERKAQRRVAGSDAGGFYPSTFISLFLSYVSILYVMARTKQPVHHGDHMLEPVLALLVEGVGTRTRKGRISPIFLKLE